MTSFKFTNKVGVKSLINVSVRKNKSGLKQIPGIRY